mgnify:CR=1 FL=1
MVATLTLAIPDAIYQRLLDTANATNRPLEDIVRRVFEVGSPPSWTDAPEPFQSDLAGLDRLDNEALWAVAYGQMPSSQDDIDHRETADFQEELDRFMLRKAQAAAILRWRGCHVPLP